MTDEKYVGIRFPFTHTFTDFPDSTSCSLIIYLLGCEHFCINCHNQDLQLVSENKNGHIVLHSNTLSRNIIQKFKKDRFDNIIFSGGDPLYGNNLQFVKNFCKENGHLINICIYTGYGIDYIKQNEIKGFRYIKCGKYEEHLKQEPYKNDYEMQLASSNQNFFDDSYNQLSENGKLKFF